MINFGKESRTEQYLLLAALILAVFLRFFQLGVTPLTDSESRLALQALDIARGGHPMLNSNPGYILLTALNFFIFGAGNFLARFWPALAGASLVLLPISFSRQLGRRGAILLAFALAIDPGFIAVSRIAGDQMMALGFLVLFISFLHLRYYGIAGVMAGLSLLAGPSIWFGLLGIAVTLVLVRLGKQVHKDLVFPDYSAHSIRTMFSWGLGTLLLVGTLGFFVLNGLSAWAGSLTLFIKWFFPSIPSQGWYPWLTLMVYEPLLLLLGVIALVVSFLRNDRKMINLAVLSFVFLFLASMNPSHQPGDIAWFILPFWVFAVMGLSHILDGMESHLRGSIKPWLIAGIVFIFMVFLSLNLKALPASLGINNEIFQSRILLITGSLVLLVLVVLLVSAVWDEKIAQAGLLLGSLAALTLYTISAAVGGAGIKSSEYSEIWQNSPRFSGADLLVGTIQDLSQWQIGQPEPFSITFLSDADYPSLRWVLRDFKVEQVISLPMDASPRLVIHAQGDELALTGQYFEQDFEIARVPAFSVLEWDGWLRWSLTRLVPHDSSHIVLAVRADLLPVSSEGDGQ
ncbi:MAG TPA: hypothetical protein VJZ78_06110 [Anaerolineales bacterium]|nr:hypothetical protein [Anaerolineales bacterium]